MTSVPPLAADHLLTGQLLQVYRRVIYEVVLQGAGDDVLRSDIDGEPGRNAGVEKDVTIGLDHFARAGPVAVVRWGCQVLAHRRHRGPIRGDGSHWNWANPSSLVVTVVGPTGSPAGWIQVYVPGGLPRMVGSTVISQPGAGT